MKKLAEEKMIAIDEEGPKVKEVKMNAITFCRLNAINRLYHDFIKKRYVATELRTEKEWEKEFRSQKVID